MRKHLLLPLAALVFCHCSKETVPEGNLVVDGWIENGRPPVVMLTRSIVVGKQKQWDMEDMTGRVITDARVTVSDGEKEYVLTGMPSEEHFPPFVYSTTGLLGEPGKSYTLTVRSGEREATARVALPRTAEMDRLEPLPMEGGGYALRCRFKPLKGQYYGFFTRREGKELMFLPAFMSLVNGDTAAPEMEIILTSGVDITSSSRHKMYFESGETVSVRFCTIEREVYEFWKGYEDAWLFTHNPFFPVSSDVPSNIRGGYGLWAGYSSTYYQLTIP